MRLRQSDLPQPAAARRSATPDGTVIYAIGDIHGCVDPLRELLEGVRCDSGARRARRQVLVFLGDYVNRGPDNRAVIELARDPGLPGVEVVALKGNNEDLMLRFIDGDLSVGVHWLDFGGSATVADYGVAVGRRTGPGEAVLEKMRWQAENLDDYGVRVPGLEGQDVAALDALRREFAAALAGPHLEFLRSLRVAHREGDYYFAHAGIVPGVALEDQPELHQMWIRKRFLDSPLDHGAIIVHGHSITALPEVRHNRIGIDTGAYQSGVLTCLVLDGEERSVLQTG